MKKDSYNFNHDAYAFLDPKIQHLFSKMGIGSYGVYNVILEYLRREETYKFKYKYLVIISRVTGWNNSKVLKLIKEFDLFILEKEEFYSKPLLESMVKRDHAKQKMSIAGRRGNDIKKQAHKVDLIEDKQSSHTSGTNDTTNTPPERVNDNNPTIKNDGPIDAMQKDNDLKHLGLNLHAGRQGY